jgi:predicted metal-binding protein
MQHELIHKTANNIFSIEIFKKLLNTKKVIFNKCKFDHFCKSGCKNYNQKYSCPPFSPSFELLSPNFCYVNVLLFLVKTTKFQKEFNTIRMINVVLKSIHRKLFDKIDQNLTSNNIKHIMLENGSCRFCKPCKLQLNLPCRFPEKMRPSLEATGVDVNQLTIDCFGFPLQWYSKNNFPKYQCVVGGILLNEPLDIKIEEYINL